MADQVNPLGSLAAGILPTLQVAAKPPAPANPNPAKVADSQPKGPEERPADVSAKTLDKAAQKLKEYFQSSQSDLKFSVDNDTGDVVFKIINATTQEVIRQVPSEEVLVMAHKLRGLSKPQDASGVLMDKEG